jgi:hypothetical protein
MSEDRWMRELGRIARDEREGEGRAPADLRGAIPEADLDAIAARTRAKLGAAAASPPASATVPITAAKKRARWVSVTSVAAPLALAAAVALYVGRGGPGPVAATYDLVVEGGEREMRAVGPAPTGPTALARDGRVSFLLRPRSAAPGGAAVRVMVEHEGALRTWEISPRVSPEGVMRLDATPSELASLPAGPSRVLLFVGPAARLPTDDASARRILGGADAEVQTLTRDVVMTAP